MANNLRCSAAEESEDTPTRRTWQTFAFPRPTDVFITSTGYEPNLLTFDELYDSSAPFSIMIPSTDQDVDDLTFGEMLTAAHRRQVDYYVPGQEACQSVSRRRL